jgi:hypothetical protein
VVSNFASIPVAPVGKSVCADPALGFSGADLQANASGGLNAGVIDLISVAGEQADGKFSQFDLDTLTGSPNLGLAPSLGSCTVFEFHGTDFGLPTFAQPPGLDAGAQLNVSAPGGSASLMQNPKGSYNVRQGGGGGGGRKPFLAPGVYTLDNAAGGADVGRFSASITIPPTVVWTNQPPALGNIPRSRDLQITWSGGEPNDVVAIYGASVSPAVPNGLVGEFICAAPAKDGQFTVPADVLANIPATSLPVTAPTALIAVGSFSSARFTATGLDFGYIWSLLAAVQAVTFQ